MLNSPALHLEDIAEFQDGLNEWNCLHPESEVPENPSLQNHWSSIVVAKSLSELQFNNDEEKARLLAI